MSVPEAAAAFQRVGPGSEACSPGRLHAEVCEDYLDSADDRVLEEISFLLRGCYGILIGIDR